MMKSFTLVAVCLLTFAAAMTTLGQDNPASSSAKLEVVVSRFVGETKVASQPFFLLLKTGEKGSLTIESKVTVDTDAKKDCPVPSVTPPTKTQLDAVVGPKADDRFSVELTITDRTFEGCRSVGAFSVPVFSNRIIAKSVTLRSGDPTQVDFAPVRNKTIKVDVTLTMK